MADHAEKIKEKIRNIPLFNLALSAFRAQKSHRVNKCDGRQRENEKKR